jgi:hypothetical protein
LLRKKKCELGNNPKMGYDNSNGFELEMSFMLELHILHFVTMGDREPQGLSSSFPSSAQFLLDWDLYRNVFNIDLVLSINKKNMRGGPLYWGVSWQVFGSPLYCVPIPLRFSY